MNNLYPTCRLAAALMLAAAPLLAGAQKAATPDTLRYISLEEKNQGQFLWYGLSPKGYPPSPPRVQAPW